MKLLYCPHCHDVVQMRHALRTCECGKSSGHYLDDNDTVEQTAGTVSIALHNHDLKTALAVFADAPQQWHPLFTFRAYLNPLCETDVRYVEPPPPAPSLDELEAKHDLADR